MENESNHVPSGELQVSGGSKANEPSLVDPIHEILKLVISDSWSGAPEVRAMARCLLEQVDMTNALERMLATQLVGLFARSVFLTRYADKQKHPKWFTLYSAECNRTMASFRKQMAALNDLRRPRAKSFTAIRTAHFTEQQVVVTTGQDSARPTGRPTALPIEESNVQSRPETQASTSFQQDKPGGPEGGRLEEPPLDA